MQSFSSSYICTPVYLYTCTPVHLHTCTRTYRVQLCHSVINNRRVAWCALEQGQLQLVPFTLHLCMESHSFNEYRCLSNPSFLLALANVIIREPTHSFAGLWHTTNCGEALGFVCKKNSDGTTAKTQAPTVQTPGYCPKGYLEASPAGGIWLNVDQVRYGLLWFEDQKRYCCVMKACSMNTARMLLTFFAYV